LRTVELRESEITFLIKIGLLGADAEEESKDARKRIESISR
jgi:hypothetical protein